MLFIETMNVNKLN